MLRRVPALLLLLALTAPSARAEEEGGEAHHEKAEERGWEILLQPYLFLAARTDGEASVRGFKRDVESKLSDLTERLQVFSLSARVEIWSPFRLGFVADMTYLKTRIKQDDVPLLGGNVILTDSQTETGAVDLFLGYKALQLEAGPVALEAAALLGVAWRYQKLTHEIVAANMTRSEEDESADWAELLVGVDAGVFFLEGRWGFIARGELGGFGIGSAPELSWKLGAAVRWHPTAPLSIELGYLVDYVDFSRSLRGSTFAFEGVQHGPTFGVGIHF